MKGFTLIEILVVTAIMALLTGASVPIVGNLQKSSQLNEGSTHVIQTVRVAKERASSRLNDAQHGVKFLSGSYVLYQGDSYVLRDDSYDRTITLDNALSLVSTLQDDDVNFSKGLGMPNNTGSVTLTHSVHGTKIITVNSFGKVEE
jgi:prepilin-type N-terminal cleavage/methylation domain-containing protein